MKTKTMELKKTMKKANYPTDLEIEIAYINCHEFDWERTEEEFDKMQMDLHSKLGSTWKIWVRFKCDTFMSACCKFQNLIFSQRFKFSLKFMTRRYSQHLKCILLTRKSWNQNHALEHTGT